MTHRSISSVAATCAMVALCSAGLLAGCSKLLGIEGTEQTEADAGVPDAGPDLLLCADVSVPSTDEVAPVDTETSTDDLVTSCGDDGAVDQTFAWVAPVTDYYVFDTFDAAFDTVLALYDQCDGRELGCSNNVDARPQSELVRKFQQGEGALIAVEGFAGDTGVGNLNIHRVTCPDSDIEGANFPLELSTVSFGDDSGGACGGDGQEDRAYHFVAPADGLYRFDVTGDGFNPAISVLGGPRCGDRVLGCNAGAPGVGRAEVTRRLRAGEPVSLIVDGVDGAGRFTVNVEERADTCPEEPLAVGDQTFGTLGPRVVAASCAPAEATGRFGERVEQSGRTFGFQAPQVGPPCFGSCEVKLTSDEPMALFVLEGGDCGGAEMDCRQTSVVSGRHTVSVAVPSPPDGPGDFVIGVADVEPGDGDSGFELEAFCFVACP